jgi:hypothetical protein
MFFNVSIIQLSTKTAMKFSPLHFVLDTMVAIVIMSAYLDERGTG